MNDPNFVFQNFLDVILCYIEILIHLIYSDMSFQLRGGQEGGTFEDEVRLDTALRLLSFYLFLLPAGIPQLSSRRLPVPAAETAQVRD